MAASAIKGLPNAGLTQAQVDARVVAGVEDWAHAGDTTAIPANKLTNAPSGAVASDATLTGVGTVADPLKVANPITAAEKAKIDAIGDTGTISRNIRIGRLAASTFTASTSKDTGMVLNPADVDNRDRIEFLIYDDEDTAAVQADGVRWKGLTDLSTDAVPTMGEGTFIEATDATLGTFKIGRRATGDVFVEASTTGQVTVVGYRMSSNATSVGRKLVGTSITGMTTRYAFASPIQA